MRKYKSHTPMSICKRLNIICNYDSLYGFSVLALFASLIFFSFCYPKPVNLNPKAEEPFLYNLESPDDKYKLPGYLEEVSGLSYYGKGKIACVQDEKAFIYVLNLEEEKISKKYDFGSDGDYEDIAVVGKTAYILENNGDIFRVKDFKKKDRKIKKYKTPLKEKNDCEGMAYDPLLNALLIACKGSPSIEKEEPYEGYKAIYKFDLEEKELDETPYFLVDLKRLDSYMDQNVFTRLSVKVAKSLRLIDSETNFQPSGLAIHPLSGEIYVIASAGKLLIILNRQGKVQDVKELDPKEFRQPEGICFSPNGDMYISNEGQGGKGYILKFKIHDLQE